MTLRACLYARYSSDKQRETSIDDQLRAAHERAAREGWTIVATHSDEGISGSTPIALRAGGKALLAGALAGRYDVLIVEGLDRISREIGEGELLVKRLEHRSIRIIGTADGYDSEARGKKVMRIARGLVNELYLDDLREKTHRGLAGQVDRGLSAGGRSYGYRSEDVEGRAGGRRLVIDDTEAAIVREVFESFAGGSSVREIVHRLNHRGVPSARGGSWSINAVHGSQERGLGMLHNQLYRGQVIWNRRQWVKDPDTGARRYVERPEAEWQIREAPELRIVTDEVWEAVQQRAKGSRSTGTRVGPGGMPKTLFGGMLVCHACGGPYIAVNSTRYGCSIRQDRGPSVCANRLTVKRDDVDRRLLSELREGLLDPAAINEMQGHVRRMLTEARQQVAADEGPNRRRLQALQGEIDRLVDAVAAMGLSDALRARLAAAEAERSSLEAQLAAAVRASAMPDVSEVMSGYRALVLQLQAVLTDEQERDRTRKMLADLMGPVVIGQDAETGNVYAEYNEPAGRLLIAACGGSSLELVAGAGFFFQICARVR